MIRGAIALGLAIKAEHYFSEYDFVVASVLALVIVSTLLFGSFMPLVAKCLLQPPASGKQAKIIHTTSDVISEQIKAGIFDSNESPRFNQQGPTDKRENGKEFHSLEAKT